MLEITDLTVAYGQRVVLHGVSLNVAAGEILALIGPNGSGKTTLIRAASGVIAPRGGEIRAGGQPLTRLSPAQRARRIAVVPQARQLGGAFTVEQAVMLGRTAYMGWLGRAGERDRQAVQQALEHTQLTAFSGRKIAQLSGGEQQRVLLARALAQSTPVLLLDEPTNHLDLNHQVQLLALVRRLCRQRRIAVLMAMHDLNLVSAFADRVVLLVEGRIQASGLPTEVLRPEQIAAAYQARVEVIPHPRSGLPLVFPEIKISENNPAGE